MEKKEPDDDREKMVMYEVSYRLIKDSTMDIEVDDESQVYDRLLSELEIHVLHLEEFDLIVTKKEKI